MARPPAEPAPRLHGPSAPLPFPAEEYAARLEGVRDILQLHGLDAALLTGRAAVAYLSGADPAPSAPPSACLVTATGCTLITPQGTAGDTPHSAFPCLHYPEWTADGFWQAVAAVAGTGRAVGVEAEDLTMDAADRFGAALRPRRGLDISPALRQLRMVRSPAEIALLRALAQVADAGGAAVQAEVRAGREASEVVRAAEAAMAEAFIRHLPQAEGGAFTVSIDTAPARRPGPGDALPFVAEARHAGYEARLGRMLPLGAGDPAGAAIRDASLAVHRLGLGRLAPGQTLARIAAEIDAALAAHGLAPYQAGTHGHLLGATPGWEGAAQIRAGNETELEPGMVLALHPRLRLPEGSPAAGICGAEDLVLITDEGSEVLTGCPHAAPPCPAGAR